MKANFGAPLLVALVSFICSLNAMAADPGKIDTTNSGQVQTADVGEVHAVDYYQHQKQCTTIPHFGDQVTQIGATTRDSEKDTVAYPVKSLDTVCSTDRSK